MVAAAETVIKTVTAAGGTDLWLQHHNQCIDPIESYKNFNLYHGMLRQLWTAGNHLCAVDQKYEQALKVDHHRAQAAVINSTRVFRIGNTSAANHGLFFCQKRLRGEGCGKGK